MDECGRVRCPKLRTFDGVCETQPRATARSTFLTRAASEESALDPLRLALMAYKFGLQWS